MRFLAAFGPKSHSFAPQPIQYVLCVRAKAICVLIGCYTRMDKTTVQVDWTHKSKPWVLLASNWFWTCRVPM